MQRSLFALYSATLISGIGSGMLLVMVNWVLIEHYESSSLIGILTAVSYLVSFFALPQISVWLDRYIHRVVLQRFYLFGLLIQSIACIFIAQQYWVIAFIVVATISSVVIRLADQMARLAIAQSLVDATHFKMVSRHLEILRQSITLISGIIVAVFIDYIELVDVLIVDIVSFLLAAALLGLVVLPEKTQSTESSEGEGTQPDNVGKKESVFTSFVKSYSYFKAHPYFWAVMTLSLAPYVLVLSQNAIHPAHIEQFLNLGGEAYAMMGFVFGAGSLMAPFVSNYLHKQNKAKEVVILIGFIGYFIASIVIMLYANIWVTYFCLCLFSMSHSMIRIERLAFLMSYVPKDKIGRISGAFELTGLLFVVLCTFLIGFIADIAGILFAWGAMSLFVGVALVAFLYMSNFSGENASHDVKLEGD